MLSRNCHRAVTSHSFFIQRRTTFTEKYRHGPMSISNPDPDRIRWIRDIFGPKGWQLLKSELKFLTDEETWKWRKRYLSNTLYKFEDFDNDEFLQKWKARADSDSLNGYSHCSIVRSPAGHALFKGFLDNRLPDDGITGKSGFVAMIGPGAPGRPLSLSFDTHWDWGQFNSIEIRFRGDGRRYRIVCSTGTYMDDTKYYDAYVYPLYTTGGPYWQTVRIPFSKFVFLYKGFIQDQQGGLDSRRVKFVALALEDYIDGPFAIEIDYIGLVRDTKSIFERSAYEHYSFPHIRYKQLSVGCDPPQYGPQ